MCYNMCIKFFDSTSMQQDDVLDTTSQMDITTPLVTQFLICALIKTICHSLGSLICFKALWTNC
jgi:hypothetical protein